MDPAYPSSAPPNPKRRRGCLFYGCLTAVILLAAAGVATYFGLRYVVSKSLETFSTTTPQPLPPPRLTADEARGVIERANAFTAALQSGQGESELRLSKDELNALIAYHPALGELKDRVYLTSLDPYPSALINLPLSIIGYPGRYITGSGAFEIKTENGQVELYLRSLSLGGQGLPDSLLQALLRTNLVSTLYEDPKKAAELRKIESIVVEKDGVFIRRAPTPP